MHWNSQLHIDQVSQNVDQTNQSEEIKEEVKVADGADDADPLALARSEEIEPTYETELRHANVSQFKKAMGLFVDNYKLNYATAIYS